MMDARPSWNAWNLVPLTSMETCEQYRYNDDKCCRKYPNNSQDDKDEWYTRGT